MLSRRTTVAALALTIAATFSSPAQAAEYDDRIHITFPVDGNSSYTDDYDTCRSGCSRRHKATDIMAGYGQPVHAAKSGRITWITGLDGNPPSYGYMITIAGNDGRSYDYVHLGRQNGPPSEAYAKGLVRGSKVKRGQLIGYVGCSGNASCSAPHLHFSIEDPAIVDPYGTHMRNPYRSLKAAERRGDIADALYSGTSSATTTAPADLSGGTPLTGDFDGNGTSDLGWYLDGKVALRLSAKNVLRFSYGRAGDLPVAGDWNGDGVSTLGIIRDGRWHLINEHRSGAADVSFTYGKIGTRGDDLSLVGDWDGDGRTTIGIIRDGTWHLRNSLSSGAGEIVFTYGRIGPRGDDIPVVGDWNADGRDDPGILRDGAWHLRTSLSSGASEVDFLYGRVTQGDRPVTGDWNGTGGTTPGIVRGQVWYLRNVLSSGPADAEITFAG